jgi:hypothetical protein
MSVIDGETLRMARCQHVTGVCQSKLWNKELIDADVALDLALAMQMYIGSSYGALPAHDG